MSDRIEHHRVVIVGSGFSGLGMAIELKRTGEDDFVVLERAQDVGGTWRDNAYPGAACDVPSRLYSFSFAPNPAWSRSFSPQPEILDYLRRCADAFGIRPHLRFGARVERAEWQEDLRRWHVRTADGTERTCDVLVAAAGAMSTPRMPDVPGLDSFAGEVVHSAQWNHAVPLDGKRVAVIGTGASAIQIVPEVQPRAHELKVFQRTPAWVIPRTDRPFTRVEKLAYARVPGLDRLARQAIFWGRESYAVGFTRATGLMRLPERIARAHLRRQVPDPVTRAKLTPDYRIGCKRILISNDFYPALSAPNADVITERITEVRPNAIVTADGVEHPVDVIIAATGFEVTPPPVGRLIAGRGGRTLGEAWDEEGMKGLRGTTFAGFPNLFVLVGPNTGLGHTSMVYVIESQIAYVLDALRVMREDGVAVVDARAEAQDRFTAWVHERMRGTVWTTGGCGSWYLDQHGNNVTLWPDFTFRFRRETSRFDPSEYHVERAGDRVAVTA